MAHARCKPFHLTASGVVAPQSATRQSVTVHSMILSETTGTTNEIVSFYVPTPLGDGGDAANAANVASASGTKVLQVTVPKGTFVAVPDLCGIYFEDGLYVALSGGTPYVLLGIS